MKNKKSHNNNGLSSNQLKLLAVIFMTIDHIGYILFPGIILFRIIGRLSFPIFAFAISEGCRHTRSRCYYLLTLALSAILFQIVYTFVTGSLIMNIFVTLTLSVLTIIIFDKTSNIHTKSAYAQFAIYAGIIFSLSELLPKIISGFYIDYGFFGILLPVWYYIGRTKKEQLLYFAIGLILLSGAVGAIQFFSLLSLPVIALYNGRRGKMHLKWFFYTYYPLHLAVLHLISVII